MKTSRRSFIKTTMLGTAAGYMGIELLSQDILDVDIKPEHGEGYQEPPKKTQQAQYLEKIRNFDNDFQEDIRLSKNEYRLLKTTVARLDRVKNYVGYGNFNLLSFDQALVYASKSSKIGNFKKDELDFIERIFESDATKLGFFGDKVIQNLTSSISSKDVTKIPHSGHYIFRGDAERMYEKISQDLGGSVILTSGVRSVMKQVHLFMRKAVETNGNLSRASRSLAPPGHSYHGVGDFDVGKIGYGYLNFTEKFAETDEYKKLIDLGYVDIRYSNTNPFGVRFEPWHIKVI